MFRPSGRVWRGLGDVRELLPGLVGRWDLDPALLESLVDGCHHLVFDFGGGAGRVVEHRGVCPAPILFGVTGFLLFRPSLEILAGHVRKRCGLCSTGIFDYLCLLGRSGELFRSSTATRWELAACKAWYGRPAADHRYVHPNSLLPGLYPAIVRPGRNLKPLGHLSKRRIRFINRSPIIQGAARQSDTSAYLAITCE